MIIVESSGFKRFRDFYNLKSGYLCFYTFDKHIESAMMINDE